MPAPSALSRAEHERRRTVRRDFKETDERSEYVLSEQCAEGFFDLADGDELNVELLPVQAREVVLGDDDV